MNAWEILGIEPTKDKKEIKKAYARLLKQYHPEENPEEFKHILFIAYIKICQKSKGFGLYLFRKVWYVKIIKCDGLFKCPII